jgi:O-antigen ligase
MLLFLWLFALLLHHGLPRGLGGGIGGINRNTTSALGLSGMICCALSAKRSVRLGGMAGCALFALMVTSRGTLVAMGVFLAVYYILHKGTTKAIWHALLAAFLMLAILLVSSYLQKLILEDVMRLHDKARGLGSGFTGRVESWLNGIEIFWRKPLTGHGFRAGIGAHSGYITLLVETGLFGTLLAVAALVAEAIESFRINTVACATMFTMLTLWVYEPLYLNLGTAISLTFFLVFGAPELVAARRGPVRR